MADLPSHPNRGRPARQDYEYGRAGVANLFMCYEPLAGRRAGDGAGAAHRG